MGKNLKSFIKSTSNLENIFLGEVTSNFSKEYSISDPMLGNYEV